METGLDRVQKLEPGRGWVAADVQISDSRPLAASIEAGMKLSPTWSAYGDVWVQPTEQRGGANIGARFKNNFDLFAGGWADLKGGYEAQAGAKWRF